MFHDSALWLSNSKTVYSEETYHAVSDRMSQKIADITHLLYLPGHRCSTETWQEHTALGILDAKSA